MLISLEAAAIHFETNLKNLSCNPKYRPFIKRNMKTNNVSLFDIDAYYRIFGKKESEYQFSIDMVNFAEFVIDIIGEKNFFNKIPTLKRISVRKGFEKSRFTLAIAQLIKNIFYELYGRYLNYEVVISEYIPPKHRTPLTDEYVKTNYWIKQKTISEIAEELNVPQGWVIGEIKRLGLQKKINGIKVKSGQKGTTMSKEQRTKRKNQPLAKPIVQICPKTFTVVREYTSQNAVNVHGFSRGDVRQALKRCGLSGGFLWAFKGMEEGTIKVARKKQKIDVRVKVHEYIPPNKEELYKGYILEGKSAAQIAKLYGCHKNTIAKLCSKYKLNKPKSNLTIEKLKKHYIDEKMMAQDISKLYNLSEATIRTRLSKNGIKKRKPLL